jgi:teichuronic acid biosynthesis glycosyltransferase TuaC
VKVLVVTNMYPTRERPHAGTFVEQQVTSLERLGLATDVLFVDRAALGPSAYSGFPRELRRMIALRRPDLVHVMYGGVVAYLASQALRRRLPFVISFCGSDLLGEPLARFTRKLLARGGVWCSHQAARKADGIIVKSKNLRAVLPAGIDPATVAIIPNGVDLRQFQPLDRESCLRALGWSPTSFHVVFPANAGDPVKRYPLAVAATERLKSLGVPAILHRLEGVAHSQVPVWLNAGNVLLVTSDHEGSPNVVKEAMACNLPIVSVDVGDVRERISGIDGCHISVDVPTALAAALAKVAQSRARPNARKFAEDLSLDSAARKVCSLYHQAVKRRRDGTPQ